MTIMSPVTPETIISEAFDLRIVQWSFLRRLMNERQRILYEYWLDGSEDGVFDLSTFDPLAVWQCVGYLHIVQYKATRDDFFYRLSGDISARAARRSLHKHWVEDHPDPGREKVRTHYQEVMASGRPWLGEVYAVDSYRIAPYWNRMVLPMVDPEDPDGFVCLVLAEPQDTLPVPDRSCAHPTPECTNRK